MTRARWPHLAADLRLRSACALAIAALHLALMAGAARAHITSTGLAALETRGDQVAYRLTLVASEIGEPAAAIVRGSAGDATAAAHAGELLRTHISVAVDGQACRIRRTRLQASQLDDSRVVLLLDFHCSAAPGRLQLVDTLSAAFGEHYRSIASVARPDGIREERVFDREHPRATFDFGHAAASGVGGFARLGMEHILGGTDHLLFLAALLLGSRGLRSLLITITAFTAAHSLSLAAATLGWAHVSGAWIEPAIAASIVWLALENLQSAHPPLRRHLLTFAFGLVHGLAFAEALIGLDLAGWPLARALLGFNLGVELGQALVVALLAPALAWMARRTLGPRIERTLSVGIAAMGLLWLMQRLVLT
jgi:hypothetical protein